jgi:hypothetical protein
MQKCYSYAISLNNMKVKAESKLFMLTVKLKMSIKFEPC